MVPLMEKPPYERLRERLQLLALPMTRQPSLEKLTEKEQWRGSGVEPKNMAGGVVRAKAYPSSLQCQLWEVDNRAQDNQSHIHR